MDYRVGQVLDAVKEAGLDDSTIFILSSDNAGGGTIPQTGPGSNGPWRGDFFNTPFEGSMRVPAMIRWPGKVPGRSRHRTDACCGGKAAYAGRDGGNVEPGTKGSAD